LNPNSEVGTVSVRLHPGSPQGAKPKAEVVAGILGENSRAETLTNF
jgi:hypothetical protein